MHLLNSGACTTDKSGNRVIHTLMEFGEETGWDLEMRMLQSDLECGIGIVRSILTDRKWDIRYDFNQMAFVQLAAEFPKETLMRILLTVSEMESIFAHFFDDLQFSSLTSLTNELRATSRNMTPLKEEWRKLRAPVNIHRSIIYKSRKEDFIWDIHVTYHSFGQTSDWSFYVIPEVRVVCRKVKSSSEERAEFRVVNNVGWENMKRSIGKELFEKIHDTYQYICGIAARNDGLSVQEKQIIYDTLLTEESKAHIDRP